MSNPIIFTIACLAFAYTAILRLAELKKSKANQASLASQGFKRRDSFFDYLSMVVMHVLFFVAIILECIYSPTIQTDIVAIFAILVFAVSQFIRYSAIKALGQHWNTNVMSSENNKNFVNSGPYAFIRHPNYLAIILEFASLPLIFGAWRSALLFTILNAMILYRRILLEEKMLFSIPNYKECMGNKYRLFPGIL